MKLLLLSGLAKFGLFKNSSSMKFEVYACTAGPVYSDDLCLDKYRSE